MSLPSPLGCLLAAGHVDHRECLGKVDREGVAELGADRDEVESEVVFVAVGSLRTGSPAAALNSIPGDV
jgi:hypothetical protein